MASKAKRLCGSIRKINERYFFGVLVALCNQKLGTRIGYAFDIIFKRYKYEKGD